jgi:hypothetical protein
MKTNPEPGYYVKLLSSDVRTNVVRTTAGIYGVDDMGLIDHKYKFDAEWNLYYPCSAREAGLHVFEIPFITYMEVVHVD